MELDLLPLAAGPAPSVSEPHCETIPSRLRQGDWTLLPHRHADLHELLWVTRGSGRATLDGVTQGFGPNTLIFAVAGTVHGFAFTAGTLGFVLTIPDRPGLPAPEEALLLRVTGTSQPPVLTGLFAAIADEHDHDRPHRTALMAAQAITLAVTVLRLAAGQAGPPATPARRLMARFVAQVEDRVCAGWGVAEHAAALGVSAAHLARICRELAGTTPLALIHERVLLEARRALAGSDLKVTEIARALGFADPAYFTRFFAEKTGQPPGAFRCAARHRSIDATRPPGSAGARPTGERP